MDGPKQGGELIVNSKKLYHVKDGPLANNFYHYPDIDRSKNELFPDRDHSWQGLVVDLWWLGLNSIGGIQSNFTIHCPLYYITQVTWGTFGGVLNGK